MLNAATVHEYDFSAALPDCTSPPDAERFFLLREMHHRLANSFTALTAMMRRELRWSTSSNLDESLDRCEARFVAFADLHRFLTVGAGTGWISAQSYVEQLGKALAEALLKPQGLRCEVSADATFLPSEYCELLGLVITELVTNSAKHAFRGRGDGAVRIEFVTAQDTWDCIVSDNGVGAQANSSGVGSKILATLLRALGAALVSESGPRGTTSVVHCHSNPNSLGGVAFGGARAPAGGHHVE